MNDKLPMELLPEAMWFQKTKSQDSYGYHRDRGSDYITPYGDAQGTLRIMLEHGIKMPFERVIEQSDGISVCPHCNARYVGNQDICVQKVEYAKFGTYWSPQRLVGAYKGMKIKSEGLVKEVELRQCDGFTKWDLQAQFDLQREFFEFVWLIGTVDRNRTNLLDKFASSLPPGSAQEYRLRLIERDNEELKMRMEQVMEACRTIAEKMHNAGVQLQF